MMERFYQRIQTGVGASKAFVDPLIRLPDGRAVPALLTLLDHFKLTNITRRRGPAKRVWITGRAGTGKTTLLESLLAIVTAPPTLAASWAQFGVVPFLIRIRNIPKGQIIVAINGFFADYGIKDKDLVDRLLRTGDFLLILDGANEGDADNAIEQFATTFPTVPMIITSQTKLELPETDYWVLPVLDPAFARKVLAVHAPSLTEQDITDKVPTDLWPELKSGYDVVLLADLLRNKRSIPDSKIELYEATMRNAQTLWEGTGAFASLAASLYRRAWKLWLDGTYFINSDEQLPAEFVTFLTDKIHIITPKGEFHHELMRQYLAACWLVRESVAIPGMVSRLEDKAIWQLGQTQQREVFTFLVELLKSQEELQAVADCAGANIGLRSILAEAVQKNATKRGWKISIELKPNSGA
jgi:energy-coupling factor transporter ATP-binding protein EcfA2